MKTALKIAVTLGLLAFLATQVDMGAVLGHAAQADPAFLAAAVLCQFLSTVVASYRWFFIMRVLGHGRNWGFFLRSYFKGAFFNQLLPSNIGGDVVRVMDVKRTGVDLAQSFFGVFIDRLFGILGLLFIGLLAALATPGFFTHDLEVLVILVFAAGIGGVLFLTLFHRWTFLRRRRLLRLLVDLSLNLYQLFRRTRSFIAQFGLSIVTHVFSILAVWFIALAVGIDQAFILFLTLIPLVMLFMALPISLAGWGVREGAMVGLFLLAGIDKGPILSVSLLYGLVVIVTILPGYLAWATDRDSLY
ncbi:lysylphosphatidylglycerol synthase transmembrane domain-containing protein [Telmatospirillum sp. J64-1]|uniref:lysylphosphatidylglycerol synthase transmembrane domain-containing protein n=1 Tax=Telmatospirillum sp. J64-1 TaxID=2502183 RepID=UPI00163DD61E|nr:lysylphosphatidylglycerol synthase transmembrane domain-containing protein [Telmatospirillum sp. J64-1]